MTLFRDMNLGVGTSDNRILVGGEGPLGLLWKKPSICCHTREALNSLLALLEPLAAQYKVSSILAAKSPKQILAFWGTFLKNMTHMLGYRRRCAICQVTMILKYKLSEDLTPQLEPNGLIIKSIKVNGSLSLVRDWVAWAVSWGWCNEKAWEGMKRERRV